MKITVNPINKALIAVAYMSRFNWFDIATEHATTGETSSFCATVLQSGSLAHSNLNASLQPPKFLTAELKKLSP